MHPLRIEAAGAVQEKLFPTLNTEFDQEEFHNAYPDGIENDFWNTARNRLVHHFAKKYGLKNILDVGCGRGITTNYIFSRGTMITGVELGICEPIEGDATIHYNTNAIHLPIHIRENIQAIILLDVIEHIKDPEEFIQELKEYYPGLKHLLITVPACKEIWSNYDEFYGHFRRYDLPMMESTMHNTGFSIVKQQYFFHPLYWMLKVQSLSKKDRQIKLSAPSSRLSKVAHKLIGNMLYLDARIVPGKLKGSSLICVAELNNRI